MGQWFSTDPEKEATEGPLGKPHFPVGTRRHWPEKNPPSAGLPCNNDFANMVQMARPTTALIVEDEEHVRAFLRVLLSQVGIQQVWSAGDGAQGLAMAEQHQPELVLLDVNLPVMSGLEVLAQLGRDRPEVPVIMVSSQSNMAVVLESVKLGAVAYILKQSPPQEALRMLREALHELESGEAEAEHE